MRKLTAVSEPKAVRPLSRTSLPGQQRRVSATKRNSRVFVFLSRPKTHSGNQTAACATELHADWETLSRKAHGLTEGACVRSANSTLRSPSVGGFRVQQQNRQQVASLNISSRRLWSFKTTTNYILMKYSGSMYSTIYKKNRWMNAWLIMGIKDGGLDGSAPSAAAYEKWRSRLNVEVMQL